MARGIVCGGVGTRPVTPLVLEAERFLHYRLRDRIIVRNLLLHRIGCEASATGVESEPERSGSHEGWGMDKEQQTKSAREAQQQTPKGHGEVVNTSRRRFGIGAASAAVVMSLHAQPLKAAANCTASGWVSGNTSRHPELQDCGGRTPGYWQNENNKHHPEGWVKTRNESVSSQHGFPGLGEYTRTSDEGDFGSATLLDAVKGPGDVRLNTADNHERQVLRFGTAALLNARYAYEVAPGYPLTEDEVRDIVTEALTTGYYVASTGDRLTLSQVHAFLENTMDAPSWGPDGIA